MGISLKADFSLEMSEPKEGFKQIRNAKSFRACLQQVKKNQLKIENVFE